MGNFITLTGGTNSDYVATNNNLVRYFTTSGDGSVTLLMWVYPTDNDDKILTEVSTNNVLDPYYQDRNDFIFQSKYDELFLGIFNGNASISPAPKVNSWMQLAVTYNYNTSEMFGYVNGITACTANYTSSYPTYNGADALYFNIGRNGKEQSIKFGSLQIFNVVLEPNEIDANYLSTFDTWVCPIIRYDINNPACYPGIGTGDTIYDLVGNCNTTLVNYPTSSTTLCNTSLNFDSISQQYGYTNVSIYDYFGNNDISIFMWVHPEQECCILTQNYGGNKYSIITVDGPGHFYFGIVESYATINGGQSSNTFDLNQWHYVGLTYNSLTGDINGYVDGQNVLLSNSPSFIKPDVFNIGGTTDYSLGYVTNYFSGKTGTFEVWNRVLTPSNVLFNYLRTYGEWNCPIIHYDISNINCYPNGYGTESDTVYDLSFNSDGNANNHQLYISGNGNCNSYLYYSSPENQYLITQTDVHNYFTTNNDQSIFMWVKFTGNTNGVVLSELGSSVIDSGFHYSQIEISGGTLFINILDDYNALQTNSLGFIGYGNWNYIGFTWDNDNQEVVGYLNGFSAFTQSGIPRQKAWDVAVADALHYSIAATDSTYSQVGGYSDTNLGVFELFAQTLTPQKILDNYNTNFNKWICPVIKYDTNNFNCYDGTHALLNIGDRGAFGFSGPHCDAGLGGMTFDPVSGITNCFTYANFDGTYNQWYRTNDNAVELFPNVNNFSIFMWVRPSSDGVILSCTSDGVHSNIIEIYNNIFYMMLYNGSVFEAMPTSVPIQPNTWYYIGVTYDGTTLKSYVNGDLQGSANVTWSSPTTSLRYGIRDLNHFKYVNYQASFDMGIFEVWNKVLPYNVIYDNYINSIRYVTDNCNL